MSMTSKLFFTGNGRQILPIDNVSVSQMNGISLEIELFSKKREGIVLNKLTIFLTIFLLLFP